mmetsp:Transcript_29728/g.43951  ORF Transcript_29728/g.43951 Transcript_29728/m.43951 type:complete len:709 (-) Transcript_29728:309-2435(-)
MKIFTTVVMLLGMVAKLSSAMSRNEIEVYLQGLYNDKPYLENGLLTEEGGYQIKALVATQNALGGKEDKVAKFVKNYFAAACILYATNGMTNTKTDQLIGTTFVPPQWNNTDEWIENEDYCSWYGITCFLDVATDADRLIQINDQEIIEIQLSENILYGTWPNEVGLLGEKLVTIDLYDNFYHTAEDYGWLEDMKALKYFYFGSTSWDAEGIPSELNSLIALEQFDCSYTYWSEGPISKDSFSDLIFLEYVDMGDNIYNYEANRPNGEAILEAFSSDLLPSLDRLYFDNVRFVDENREDRTFSMDFVSKMTNVIEAWFDFTKFSGGLPDLPENLRSFSVVYCGLSGDLSNLLSTQASLDRLWLTGNSFSGSIPAGIATKHTNLTRIFLEFNSFESGPLPADICDLLENSDIFEGLGGDLDNCGTESCCTCIGLSCGNSPDPTPAPTSEGDPPPFAICFSGSSVVEVEHKGSVKMADLALGDVVRVGNNKFEPIYSFGHKDSTSSAEFLRITTEGSSAPLEISPDHMVAIEGGRYVPASLVKKGDMLLTVSEEIAAVTGIKSVVRKGVFAPFTASGSIVVNGIVASNYIAYQGSEYLKVGEMETPLSYQWIAHTFNSVHRLAVMFGITGETYSEGEEGVSHWVAMPHKMFSWLVEQNIVVSMSLIGLALPLFSLTWLIELLVSSPVVLAVVVGGVSLMTYKKSAKKNIL